MKHIKVLELSEADRLKLEKAIIITLLTTIVSDLQIHIVEMIIGKSASK